jgi:hypothetical protein
MEERPNESTELGVLNEATEMVHKHEPERAQGRAECGATNTATHDRISVVPVEQALNREDTSNCGRCFGDAGGY